MRDRTQYMERNPDCARRGVPDDYVPDPPRSAEAEAFDRWLDEHPEGRDFEPVG